MEVSATPMDLKSMRTAHTFIIHHSPLSGKFLFMAADVLPSDPPAGDGLVVESEADVDGKVQLQTFLRGTEGIGSNIGGLNEIYL